MLSLLPHCYTGASCTCSNVTLALSSTGQFFLDKPVLNFLYCSYLNRTQAFEEEQEKGTLLPANFVDNCLTSDGVFIARLVQQNSGDLFTSIMLEQMFELYKAHEAEKAHKKDDDSAVPTASAPVELRDDDDDEDAPLPPPTKATAETLTSDEEEETDVDSPDTTATLPR